MICHEVILALHFLQNRVLLSFTVLHFIHRIFSEESDSVAAAISWRVPVTFDRPDIFEPIPLMLMRDRGFNTFPYRESLDTEAAVDLLQ